MIKKIIGGIFVILFVLTKIFFEDSFDYSNSWIFDLATIIEVAIGVYCFIPTTKNTIRIKGREISRRTIIATAVAVILVPLTIYFGVHNLGNRKYYFISILIILEIMVPYIISFEKSKPNVRELVIISVLCALSVCGRMAFFWLPQFKPVVAMVIIAGVTLGGETGFLVGVITGFVSNFLFGQGAWTPWQMTAFGMVGLVSGLLFSKRGIGVTKLRLVIFGLISTVILYGGIVNAEYILVWQENPTWDMVVATYLAGLPFDLVHGVSTAIFLWFIAEPMIEKVERVKTKYGI